MISLRPSGFDELGLRRALADRILPLLVAAMAFLAALALAGWFGTAALARHWREGAGTALTVQVPQGEAKAALGETSRLAAVLAVLAATPGVASSHALSARELAEVLRPWIGSADGDTEALAIPVPAVIAVRLNNADVDLAPLSRRLSAAAPGTLVEDHGVWIGRLTVLARSLQGCAALALLVVAIVAAAVIALATRAGLATRREAIEIVHGLGAADGYIAGRFAARATLLAAIGATIGGAAALPILLALATLTAPFGESAVAADSVPDTLAVLPLALWLALPGLPVTAAAIGFVTAQATVRRWLRRLP
jgi:cell division transport system permease protein